MISSYTSIASFIPNLPSQGSQAQVMRVSFAGSNALALLAFLVQGGAWSTTWVVVILLLAAPVPAVMLFVYANPIANGLIDIAATLDAVLERSL